MCVGIAIGRRFAGRFCMREVAWRVCFRLVFGLLWVWVVPVFRLELFCVGSKSPVNFCVGFLVLALVFGYAFVPHFACGALQYRRF